MNNLGVHDVKSKQFLLITKAGLAVSQSKEKGMINIEQQILAEYTEAVKAIFLPPAFLGYDRNGFMRTKNYFIDVSKLDPSAEGSLRGLRRHRTVEVEGCQSLQTPRLRGYVVSSRVGDVCYLRRSVSATR